MKQCDKKKTFIIHFVLYLMTCYFISLKVMKLLRLIFIICILCLPREKNISFGWNSTKTELCWNSNSSTSSNTMDFLWTPSAQQVRRLFIWIFYQSLLLWFKYTGPLLILRTECVWRVSESFFSFYIDYPSQK